MFTARWSLRGLVMVVALASLAGCALLNSLRGGDAGAACRRKAQVACERVVACDLSGLQGYEGKTVPECMAKAQASCSGATAACPSGRSLKPDALDGCLDRVRTVSCNNLGIALSECSYCQ